MISRQTYKPEPGERFFCHHTTCMMELDHEGTCLMARVGTDNQHPDCPLLQPLTKKEQESKQEYDKASAPSSICESEEGAYVDDSEVDELYGV